MRTLAITLTVLVATLCLQGVSWADAPSIVPVQGVIADSNGIPIDSFVDVEFSLYDQSVGGTKLWTEVQTVDAKNGLFTVYLGRIEPLDLSLFGDHGDLWLGVQVVDDPEEGARVRIGSIPFTAFAQYSSHTAGTGISISPDNVVSSTLGTSIDATEIEIGTITADNLEDGTINEQKLATNVGVVPVGAIIAWHKDLPNMPALPAQFMECNGQVVVDEESPFYGTNLPDLNGGQRFLRGGSTSGINQAHATARPNNAFTTDNPGDHSHGIPTSGSDSCGGSNDCGASPFGNEMTTAAGSHTHTIIGGGDNETRPINMSVVWVMRIK